VNLLRNYEINFVRAVAGDNDIVRGDRIRAASFLRKVLRPDLVKRSIEPPPRSTSGEGLPRPSRRCRWSGFTLIELVVVVTIVGVLASIAIPSFQGMRERAQIVAAISDIAVLSQELTEFELINNRFPNSLAEAGLGGRLDPWGNPYQYLNHEGASNGPKRKDRFLVPVNSDYDLYSMGPDGTSVAAFPAGPSRDDIVRANNGGFIGLASVF